MTQLAGGSLVASKILPVPTGGDYLFRSRVLAAASDARPCILVAAMSGYGKSVAVRHWVERLERPAGWLNVDALDEEPSIFWQHLLAAIASAQTGIGEEPSQLLRERGSNDRVFLAALIAELGSAEHPVTLVLDGLHHRLDPSIYEGLALMVDRVHERLRLVVTTQADPPLPLGRWRAAGWVTDVREDVLRFTDDEAVALAAATGTTDHDAVRDLNRAVDGWPIAVQLALTSGWRPGMGGDSPVDDTSIAAHLTSRVLSTLDEGTSDAALSLSVLDQIDPAMCSELVGPGAAQAVRRLLEQSRLLSVVDPRTGTMRFHPLTRRILEADLGRRDPVRRVELHRRAAAQQQARGDVRRAYQHLAAIGEVEQSRRVLLGSAFDIVHSGDLRALADLAANLPSIRRVDDIHLAIGLGLIAAWGDSTMAARRWSERAEELIAASGLDETERTELTISAQRLRSTIATLDADLVAAIQLVESMPRPAVRDADPVDAHVAFVTARALLAMRHPLRQQWIDRVAAFDGSPIVVNATVPTLRAWQLWLDGRLDHAAELSQRAVTWLDEHHLGAHHLGFDTFITAGWCRLDSGDIEGARRLAERAVADTETLPCTWSRVQSAYLLGSVELASGDPAAAAEIVDEVRGTVPFDAIRPFGDRLLYLAGEAALASGRVDEASSLLQGIRPGQFRELLRARVEPLSDARLQATLADRHSWPMSARIRAEVILATRSTTSGPDEKLAEFVEQCAADGWVQPFLGLGPRAERALRALPLDRIHPRLDEALIRAGAARATSRPVPDLTPRELTLLELLPTHLSYAEIGEQMFLSVNTVKSGLKGLYRKLDAHTRSEAVAAGQSHGLI